MARAQLTVDLCAIIANWRALSEMNAGETGAVLKADAYGLGAARVGPALARAGVRSFFTAIAEEAAALREALGDGPRIFNFSGLMPGDEALILSHKLIPLLNSPAQLADARQLALKAGHVLPAGLQLDSGMNRLGFEAKDLEAALAEPGALEGLDIQLVMSHLACADEPGHDMNELQLSAFRAISSHPAIASAPKSLAATGGVLLGADYHFNLTRPGVGLFGGLPFAGAKPVVTLEAPIIQIRDVSPGEAVGYAAVWSAARPSKIATISAGYADGFLRHLSGGFTARRQGADLPSAGRVSMDLLTIDVSGQPDIAEGEMVTLIDEVNTIDNLATRAGTIGYEILTSLGTRYGRRYKEG